MKPRPAETRKTLYVCLYTIILCTLTIAHYGCEHDTQQAPDPPSPEIESLVNTWAVVSINNQPIADAFSTPEAGINAKVTTNKLVYARLHSS